MFTRIPIKCCQDMKLAGYFERVPPKDQSHKSQWNCFPFLSLKENTLIFKQKMQKTAKSVDQISNQYSTIFFDK